MPALAPDTELAARSRLAGLLYALIILAGLGAELGIRAQLVLPGDPAGTTAAILGAPGRFRLGIAADILMAVCDAGLAILLYLMFRRVAPALALAAMVFRLLQTALIAANLMAMQTGLLLLTDAPGLSRAAAEPLALVLFEAHAHGYDLGLIFFGICSLMTGALVWRSGVFARAFGAGLAAAGCVYLIGSGLRFLQPDLVSAFAPAYGVAVIAETAFCARLLLQRPAKAPGAAAG